MRKSLAFNQGVGLAANSASSSVTVGGPALGWLLLVASSAMAGCSGECDGVRDGDYLCEGDRKLRCIQGHRSEGTQCEPGGCKMVNGSAVCALPTIRCPHDYLGYQCMGEERVYCHGPDIVEAWGGCGALDQRWLDQGWGPFCVENPGGQPLPCGFRDSRCEKEWELQCFGEGSAVCLGSVWRYFVSNEKAGQTTCDVSAIRGGWKGKTWCEGDIVRLCLKSTPEMRCTDIINLMTCAPGTCTTYPSPLGENISPTTEDKAAFAGCLTDAPDCTGGKRTSCVGDMLAGCVANGKAAVTMSCADIGSVWGTYYFYPEEEYGPICVRRTDRNDDVCAFSADSCYLPSGAGWWTRCDPADPTGARKQTCWDGNWIRSEDCSQPDVPGRTTMCKTLSVSNAQCQ
jgi:hypothetical protein